MYMIIKGVLGFTRLGLHNSLKNMRKSSIFNLQYEYPHTKKVPFGVHEVRDLTLYFLLHCRYLIVFPRLVWKNCWSNPHMEYKFIGPFERPRGLKIGVNAN